MSEHDSFEDRLRALADQVSESVRRMSEVDVDSVAERYGIDAERARGFADAAGQWLSERMSGLEPLFAEERHGDGDRAAGPVDARGAEPGSPRGKPGPHPLDLPTERQGLALSALDSGRWTVSAGSSQLASLGEGPAPLDAADLAGELRARDWITADGTLTLTGRHALGRWCRAAESPTPPLTGPDAPPA